MFKILICAASFIAMGFTATFAITNAERYAKEMAKYKQTNEFENCISPSRIKQTKVLDDSHILFEMRGGRVYLNTLESKCSRLGFERAITYTVRGNRLCNVDIVYVLDPTFGNGPSCSLGKFEILEKLPKENG